jgi:hypothetical protein
MCTAVLDGQSTSYRYPATSQHSWLPRPLPQPLPSLLLPWLLLRGLIAPLPARLLKQPSPPPKVGVPGSTTELLELLGPCADKTDEG